MKTLAIILYIVGSGLLIASCFTSGIALTWWLGGGAVVALIAGCICQYNSTSSRSKDSRRDDYGEERRREYRDSEGEDY